MLFSLWQHLEPMPLFWLTLTIAVFQAAAWLFRRTGSNPLFNPVLLSIPLIILFLQITGTDYQTYFKGASFIHFLLGPATVALALPLYRQIANIRKASRAIFISLGVGSLTAITSTALLIYVLGGNTVIILTMVPKSVTTPIAMGISEKIGGIPSLTAVTVVLTGIVGAVLGETILKLFRVTQKAAIGMALGLASHGIGTSQALLSGPVAGAFGALGMALNGLFTAILLPALLSVFHLLLR